MIYKYIEQITIYKYIIHINEQINERFQGINSKIWADIFPVSNQKESFKACGNYQRPDFKGSTYKTGMWFMAHKATDTGHFFPQDEKVTDKPLLFIFFCKLYHLWLLPAWRVKDSSEMGLHILIFFVSKAFIVYIYCIYSIKYDCCNGGKNSSYSCHFPRLDVYRSLYIMKVTDSEFPLLILPALSTQLLESDSLRGPNWSLRCFPFLSGDILWSFSDNVAEQSMAIPLWIRPISSDNVAKQTQLFHILLGGFMYQNGFHF